LADIGVPADRLAMVGGYILNAQMLGMILGAFLWGWLGDRYGRLKALYGSILIYSVGTLICSWVHDPITYGILRFYTGFGLAGETGAAVTIIAEMMPIRTRGWGITFVGALGLLGPVFATVISMFAPWRETYCIAGLLGLAILVLRVRLGEPSLFEHMAAQKGVTRGSLKLLLQKRQGLAVLCGVMMGSPLIYAWFLLNFFSAEFSKTMLLPGEPFNQKIALIAFYVGTSSGDILGGALSQLCKSRRKVLAVFLLTGLFVTGFYLGLGPVIKISAPVFYATYYILGVVAGCWILMTMIFAEHFGTNIRATTSIIMSNFVRGLSIPIFLVFQDLQKTMNITNAALAIGVVLYAVGLFGLSRLRETHGVDLDYVEKPVAAE
jgi:MFS transporter, putative metabolite:H+ symporter